MKKKMNIIKRDGTKVGFDKKKIEVAIKKAMKNGSGIYLPDVAKKISEDIEKYFEGRTTPTIQMVELSVYNKLLDYDQELTAKAYEGFRAVQEFKRNTSPMDNNILNLLNGSNKDLIEENSNKNGMLASTQRDLIAGEVSKHISQTKLIPTHIIQAHNDGVIKVHDLDYFLSPITNCELVPLDDMFENGTVINKKMIKTPKSLQTAMTLATQIAAQVSSYSFGGQTMSVSHLAPYVRVSFKKWKKFIEDEYKSIGINLSLEDIENLATQRLKREIKDGVQTFNYQLLTLNSVNGQSPFLSLFMYLNENPEYIKETAMLIEEFLNQRIEGMENEYGVKSTQTFPKLIFALDENNMTPNSEYYYLKELSIKATAIRMNPDYISTKKMKEVYDGNVFCCMGCRSFLYPTYDENGKAKFYGRGNLGVTTLNLIDVALSSKGDMDTFWNILDNRLENIVKPSLEIRYNKLKGVKASVAPILWQHGVFSRLKPEEEITKAIDRAKFSVSLGYAGLYETTKYMTGEGQTEKNGYDFAIRLMKYLRDTAEKWKAETGLGFGVYGTPIESTTDWFSKKLKAKWGEIKDITDKGWITNSYHVDIREEIDVFTKLKIEGTLQRYSTGGNVSYVETYNMQNNLKALEQIVDFIYDNNVYAEINTESDVCGECYYTGVMSNDEKTLDWYCPQCGNKDQQKLSVVRRVCGYLGETTWNTGRKLDILNRVKHI